MVPSASTDATMSASLVTDAVTRDVACQNKLPDRAFDLAFGKPCGLFEVCLRAAVRVTGEVAIERRGRFPKRGGRVSVRPVDLPGTDREGQVGRSRRRRRSL